MRCKNVLCFFSENPGKISKNKRKDVTYIEYTYDRKYIPEKKYNIPLRTTIGKMNPSDPTISRFLSEICEDERIAFLNDWNEKRNHREKIYISYDSTNKNCQAGEVELAEFGHAKGKDIEKIFRILLYDRCKSGIRRFERRKNQRVKGCT